MSEYALELAGIEKVYKRGTAGEVAVLRGATPPTGGLGGRTPQRLGLSGKIGSNDRF